MHNVIAAAALAASFVMTAGAGLIGPLSDYTNGVASFTIGDKKFDQFQYVINSGDMPLAVDISIYDLTTPDIGLRFTGSFHDEVGDPASDATIQFRVTVMRVRS